MNNKILLTLNATLLTLLTAGTSSAQTLINEYGPSNITASANGSLNGFHTPVETINGSGLSTTTEGGTHGTSNRTYWRVSDGLNDFGEDNVALAESWIQWDLGASYVLDSIHVWNHNEASRFVDGINQLDIYVATSLSDPSSDPEAGSFTSDWTQIGTDVLFAEAPGATTYTGFDLVSGTTGGTVSLPGTAVRFVRFEIDTAHSFTEGGTNEVGMAEIQFYAVPEPSAFALIAGMFGLTWVMVRRRS